MSYLQRQYYEVKEAGWLLIIPIQNSVRLSDMDSFLCKSNHSRSGILYSLQLVSHVVWKSIKQRTTNVQYGGNVGINQNFDSVLAQVSSDFTYVP